VTFLLNEAIAIGIGMTHTERRAERRRAHR